MARRCRQRRRLSRSVVQKLIRRQTHVLVDCSYVGVGAEVLSVLGDEPVADALSSFGAELDIGLITGFPDEFHHPGRINKDVCGKSATWTDEEWFQQRKWRLTCREPRRFLYLFSVDRLGGSKSQYAEQTHV